MRHERGTETLGCPCGNQWEVEVARDGDGWHEPRTWELIDDDDSQCEECGSRWLGWNDWEPAEQEEEQEEEESGS